VRTRHTSPKQMATRLTRLLRPERPDDAYLKKVFQHTRALLAVHPAQPKKHLPELLTDRELMAFYEAVWQARHPIHMVMVKLSRSTGFCGHKRRPAIEEASKKLCSQFGW
jgi:hypothetical protein